MNLRHGEWRAPSEGTGKRREGERRRQKIRRGPFKSIKSNSSRIRTRKQSETHRRLFLSSSQPLFSHFINSCSQLTFSFVIWEKNIRKEPNTVPIQDKKDKTTQGCLSLCPNMFPQLFD
jgi:hypothetical protein